MPGRPTKYDRSFVKLAYNYCLLGADDVFLSKAFEVNVDTIYEWKKKHKEFSESIKRGKMIADGTIAASLFKRAKGFKFEEETFERVKKHQQPLPSENNPHPEPVVSDKLVVSKRVIKYFPPDPLSMIFWLKNRQPEMWREKPEGKQPDDDKPKPLWLKSTNLDETADGPDE
ncbi:terminase [Runella sp.]|uniref:terminase n=1 Tax=Runella sp. TaxID=1960881 RepID=UPI003D0C4EB8